MMSAVQVVLFGSLRRGRPAAEAPIPLELAVPAPLAEVLSRIGIPPDQVQLAMVNHRAVDGAALIHPRDRLALFPPEYPFFADWKDWRRRP
jgi:hypothetical protein